MLRAEETKVVNIEDRTIAVDALPDQAKQLVAFYDDWKQKELEARSLMMSYQTAMKALGQQIANLVIEAEQAAATEAATKAANDALTEGGGEDA